MCASTSGPPGRAICHTTVFSTLLIGPMQMLIRRLVLAADLVEHHLQRSLARSGRREPLQPEHSVGRPEIRRSRRVRVGPRHALARRRPVHAFSWA